MGDIYIGFDESNNGRALEIHTAVFSLVPSDASKSESVIPKLRSHKNLFNRMRNRAYSFLLFTDSDKERIEKSDKQGVISASLLVDELDWTEFDSVQLLLDGEKSAREIDRLAELVTKHLEIPEEHLGISYGGKYDQRYRVVNFADQLAHYLFKKGVSFLSEHSQRKALLY